MDKKDLYELINTIDDLRSDIIIGSIAISASILISCIGLALFEIV